jgi:SAM-dependent methyltransferase
VTAHNDTRTVRERAHFDQLAEAQGDVWWGHTTLLGRERLAQRVKLLASVLDRVGHPRCLELGCGVGTFSGPLLEAHPRLHLVAIDVSPRCIEMASSRFSQFGNAAFQLGDAGRVPLPDDSVDVVFGNGVLHHVDLDQVLTEIRRVLRPGGWMWFSEPNMLNPQVALERNVRIVGRWLQNSPDETAFMRRPLARRLRRAGFDDVTVRPYDFLHPGVSGVLLRPMRTLSAVLERTPLLREIAGSLEIVARRPAL